MRSFLASAAMVMAGCAAGTGAGADGAGGGPSQREGGMPALRVTVDGRGNAAYENVSSRSVWVTGYAPDRPHYQFQTLDPQLGVWRFHVMWCGTGAEPHEVGPGESHRFLIHGWPYAKGRAYRVVVRYRESPSWAGEAKEASLVGMD